MSHTPGPWRVRNEFYVEASNGEALFKSLFCDTLSYTQQASNAHLIAAAPDLLAACEELLLVAGTYSPIDMYDWERVSASIDRAKEAIKKARGI